MHHFYIKMLLFGLCTLFSKVTLFSLCSVGLRYAKNALAAGARPRTPLGSSQYAPQTS